MKAKTGNALRCISIVCFAVVLLFTFSASATGALPFADRNGILMPDGIPYTAELSVRVKKHIPYGDERTAWLDRLLSHVRLRLSDDGSQRMLTFLTDDSEVFTVIEQKDNGSTKTAVLPVSEKVYTGEPFLVNSGDDPYGDFLLGATGKEHLCLESLLHLFEALPAEFADVCNESRINSNIKGYGIVKNKKTITMSSEISETLSGKLAEMCDTEELAGIIRSVNFSGKQNIKLMYDEKLNLIKIIYDGNLIDGNGFKRKVSISWQHCDGETQKNKLTVKTPRSDGKGRDNFVIEESVISSGNQQQWKAGYIYEALADGVKTVTEISANISESRVEALTTLQGNIIINRKQSGKESAKTELDIDAEIGEKRKGLLSIRTSGGNTIHEDAEISFELSGGADIPDLSGYETAVLDPAVRDKLMNETAAYLVRSFVLLPREDTLFLSGDIPDETWQKITEAAGKTDKEENNP